MTQSDVRKAIAEEFAKGAEPAWRDWWRDYGDSVINAIDAAGFEVMHGFAKLDLGPNDILVVRVKEGPISNEVSERLHRHVREVLNAAGLKNEIAVVDSTLALEVIHKEVT
jgi:hypothetical protein